MTRFIASDPVTLVRDLDADEAGHTFNTVTATVDGTPHNATVVSGSVYSANLGTLPLGVHEVVWKDGATVILNDTIEVVGGFLCSVADIRAGDKEYADKARFKAETLRAARAYVEDEFEQITGRSFVRRVAQAWEYSDGSGFMLSGLRDSPTLTAVAVDGVNASLADYAIDENGIVTGPALDSDGHMVVVTVEHGFKAVPDDVKRVAGIRARSVVAQAASGVPDRATSIVSPDGGQINLATPGRAGFETGIPEVDAVLNRYTYRIERDVLGLM